MKYKYWYYTLTGQRARLAKIMDALNWKFFFSENDQRISIDANGVHAVIWMNSYPSEKKNGYKFCYLINHDTEWQHSNSLLDILCKIDFRAKIIGKQKEYKLLGLYDDLIFAE